jgi:hypothetical protein
MPLALVLAAVLGEAPSHLEAAREAMAELRYPEAKALLAKARLQVHLSREALIELLWMQGFVSASMNQADAARSAFRTLFAIDPDYTPDRDYPPKIMGPYYEARGWVASNKPLGFQQLPTARDGGRVKHIGVKIQADPLSLVAGVRFHVGDQTFSEKLEGLEATHYLNVEQVSWWAELYGDRDAQLARLGDAAHPIVELGEVPAEKAPARVEAPPPAPESQSPLRGAAIASAAVSITSLALGLAFGIRSNNDAQALKSRQHDSSGAVTDWTQRAAVQLELQQRLEAGVANAMFVLAGLTLAAAVVLFVVGRGP